MDLSSCLGPFSDLCLRLPKYVCHKLTVPHVLIVVALLLLNISVSNAQQPPDAGALQKEIETPEMPKIREFPKPDVAPTPPENLTGPSMPVQRFDFQGNTILPDTQLILAVKDWFDKKLTIAELKYVSDLVAEEYRKAGYLARVFLPKQNVNDGTVTIVVVEARFGHAKVDGDHKQIAEQFIDPKKVTDTIEKQQHQDEFLHVKKIERATLLLNDLPGFKTKAVLEASDQPGYTDLAIKLEEKKRLSGTVTVDNFGVRSTGEARLIPAARIENPFKIGDDVRLNGLYTEGNQYGRVAYSLPVGVSGVRVGANASYLAYELGDEFESLEAEGDATTIGFDISYPVIRQMTHNLNINARIAKRDYSNSQLGDETSEKAINVLTLGVSGNVGDSLYGGGMNYYTASIVSGDLDLSGNADNQAQDQAGPRTEGQYYKLNWTATRLQRFKKDTQLLFSLNGQFASRNMDSSESISLGGPTGVRAYPVLEGTGDSGMVFTFEARHSYDDNIVLGAFYDLGRVHQRRTLTTPKETHTHQGVGISLDWNKPDLFAARFVIARRIGTNPLRDPVTGNDSNGDKELWPIWVNVTKYF